MNSLINEEWLCKRVWLTNPTTVVSPWQRWYKTNESQPHTFKFTDRALTTQGVSLWWTVFNISFQYDTRRPFCFVASKYYLSGPSLGHINIQITFPLCAVYIISPTMDFRELLHKHVAEWRWCRSSVTLDWFCCFTQRRLVVHIQETTLFHRTAALLIFFLQLLTLY